MKTTMMKKVQSVIKIMSMNKDNILGKIKN